jgi:methylenetetrahydrofolate reductase (NADPH)
VTASPNGLREFAARASIEVTPRASAELAELEGLLAPGTDVYVTALPGADLDDLVTAARRVREAGHEPVPHIPARAIAGRDALDRLLGGLAAEAGVVDVLVVGGSVKEQAGEYSSSIEILESGLLEQHGIVRAGVAGHPEGTPDIPPQAVHESLAAKNAFAGRSPIELRLVSQFALAAEPYVVWERQIRAEGNRLPVVAGIPGVTSPATLIKYGLACGIGPSLEILRKQTGGLLKLATTRLWRPDDVARGIAEAAAADPDSLIRGLHVFPFGGLRRSAEWLAEMRADAPAQPASQRV